MITGISLLISKILSKATNGITLIVLELLRSGNLGQQDRFIDTNIKGTQQSVMNKKFQKFN